MYGFYFKHNEIAIIATSWYLLWRSIVEVAVLTFGRSFKFIHSLVLARELTVVPLSTSRVRV